MSPPEYCASETFSIHSADLPSSISCMAIWDHRRGRAGAVPVLSHPAGSISVSPALISRNAVLPRAWTRPETGNDVQRLAERMRMPSRPRAGLEPDRSPPAGGQVQAPRRSGSCQTVPVNQSDGARREGTVASCLNIHHAPPAESGIAGPILTVGSSDSPADRCYHRIEEIPESVSPDRRGAASAGAFVPSGWT